EAEWEKAARFTDRRLYPWGEKWRDSLCNCDSDATTPVTAFPDGASPYGCLDMLGNVREWTSTIWGTNPTQPDFSYPYPFKQDDDGRDDPNPGSGYRIYRGGCFRDTPARLRCAARGFSAENSRLDRCGFRVIMEEKK
ncbi:MAG: hypothetical protein D3909_15300, partial [Candidatus Electrothrix sp. ATG1]|nr:hypothetical protein [Candidatus Electrothrix sp. ATG1]